MRLLVHLRPYDDARDMGSVSGEGQRVLVVSAAGERFGVWERAVQSILRAAQLTRLPEAPSHVLGLLNLHGDALPVVDLRSVFVLPAKPLGPSDVLVVVATARRRWALRADGAEGLLVIDPAVLAAREAVTPRAPQVRGVASLPDGLLFLTDPDDFLDAAEHGALERALARVEDAS